jgi:hypothetical protein
LSSAITAPVAGETPAGFDNTGRTQYTGTVQWSNALFDDGVVSEFGFNQIYRARVHLTRANTNVTFTGAGPFMYYVNASPVSVVSVSASEITLDIIFPRTSVGLATVTLTHLDAYIIPPIVNGPQTQVINNSEYTGTVAWRSVGKPGWNVGSPFVEGDTYEAAVSLTANGDTSNGWTFTGSNTFSHDNAASMTTISITSKTATMNFYFECTDSGLTQIFGTINLATYLAPPIMYADPKTGYSGGGVYRDRDVNKWFDMGMQEWPPDATTGGDICVFEIVGTGTNTFAGTDAIFIYEVEGESYYADVEIDQIGYSPEGVYVRGTVTFANVYNGPWQAGNYWNGSYDY